MLKVEHQRWGQSLGDLFEMSITAEHARTRERFAALHAIASGDASAAQWARRTQRRAKTVCEWVHRYNQDGPEALAYQRFGGRRPFFQSTTPRRSTASSPKMCPKITA